MKGPKCMVNPEDDPFVRTLTEIHFVRVKVSYPNSLSLSPSVPAITSSLITIDLLPSRKRELPAFTGTAFRGWLGTALKCTRPDCPGDYCPDAEHCPYQMVFKDDTTDIKPYALLSFQDNGGVRGFIKVHGDRMRHVPEILARINTHENASHFTGLPFQLQHIAARTVTIPEFRLGAKTTISFITPAHLVKNGLMEIMPTFDSILSASVRAYNRVTKRFDRKHYPCRVPESLSGLDAPILDFSLQTVMVSRQTRNKKTIHLDGVSGWITYDTSQYPPDAGHLLKAGEYLQIGKHTTYGFGGIIPVTTQR